MKYFLDTEFHEYKKKIVETVSGHGYSYDNIYNIDTIELISIGIISEDIKYAEILNGTSLKPIDVFKNKEYYAICKDFDLTDAWDNEWLRENVLKSIWKELSDGVDRSERLINIKYLDNYTKEALRILLNEYGKTREQIAKEIREFVYSTEDAETYKKKDGIITFDLCKIKPEFYAYYADYDWVVFCWLFGRMIDLPDGFPMYCRDLQQIKDEIKFECSNNVEMWGKELNQHPDYPKQTNEHNALADAKWNYKLYKFLNEL